MHGNAATVSKNGHQDQLLIGMLKTAYRLQEGMLNLLHNAPSLITLKTVFVCNLSVSKRGLTTRVIAVLILSGLQQYH